MIECQRSQDFENFYILITCSTFITDHMYFLPECFLNIKLGKAWNIRVVETISCVPRGIFLSLVIFPISYVTRTIPNEKFGKKMKFRSIEVDLSFIE